MTLLHRSPPDTALPDPGLFVRRARAEAAGFALSLAMLRLSLALRAWNPNQPRVPAGNPDGGEWTTIGFGWARGSGETEPRTRVAQAGGGRRGISSTSIRIGGRDVATTRMEDAEIAGGEIVRDLAVERVHRLDPRWRPPAGLYETPQGYIRTLEDQTLAAEARLLELARDRTAVDVVLRDGRGRRPDADILRPDGEWIGSRDRGAGSDVRTLTPERFAETWFELSAGSHRILLPDNYRGIWYETPESSIVGLRRSIDWGPTIDLRSGDVYLPEERPVRFHKREEEQKMESIEDYFEYLLNRRYYSEMPMWYPVGEARARGLTGEARRAFLVRVVLTLLSVGAVPAEVCSPMPYGWDIRAWEGMTPQAIADAIAERMMTTPDPFEANVWWLEPYMADEVRAARTEEAAPLDGPSIG